MAETKSGSASGGTVKPALGNDADAGSAGADIGGAGKSGVIDPASVAGGSGKVGDSRSDTGKRPRGRPAGYSPKQGKPASAPQAKTPLAVTQSKPLDVNGVEAMLFSAHAILAGIAKTPEIALSKEESAQLAASVANVSRHYNVTMAEKTMDWMNLLMCAGAVYGSKFMAVKMRVARQRADNPKPEPVKPSGKPAAQAAPAGRDAPPVIDFSAFGAGVIDEHA